jgi:hypothetical protein
MSAPNGHAQKDRIDASGPMIRLDGSRGKSGLF